MTDINLFPSSHEIETKRVTYPGKKISCAVAGLTKDRLIFGFEDGHIIECATDGFLATAQFFHAAMESEPINGIAFIEREDGIDIAVSTRGEISIHRFTDNENPRICFTRDFGAHGIDKTAHDGFIAPLGPDGVMTATPDLEGPFEAAEWRNIAGRPYCYKFAPLGYTNAEGQELFAAALRTDGVALLGVPRLGRPVLLKGAKSASKPFDFVSVSGIGDPSNPRSFVALGRDRSVHFFRDLLAIEAAETLTLPPAAGTAYKILTVRGHLLILTARGLYILRDVVNDFLAGKQFGGLMTVRHFQIEASDFNLAHGEWILLVTPDGVDRMALSDLLPEEQTRRVDELTRVPEVIKKRMRPPLPPSLAARSQEAPAIEPQRSRGSVSPRDELLKVGAENGPGADPGFPRRGGRRSRR